MNPIEFPLTAEYERINNTFEGMKIRELRDGEPEIDDPRKEIEYDEGEYQPSEPGALDHGEIAERAIDDEPDDDQPLDFGVDEDDDQDHKPDDESPNRRNLNLQLSSRDEHVPVGDPSMDHMSKGTAGNGVIYLNDIGETVKLDVKGRPYKVGSDGRRFFRSSPRPRSKYTPEEWRALTIPDRIVAEKKEALEKELERKKQKDDGAGSSKDKKRKKKTKSKGKEEEDDDDPKDISPSIHFSKDHQLDYDDGVGGKSPSAASTQSTELLKR